MESRQLNMKEEVTDDITVLQDIADINKNKLITTEVNNENKGL